MERENFSTPVTPGLLDAVMMISVMFHLIYESKHGITNITYDEWIEKCEDYKFALLWFSLFLMTWALVVINYDEMSEAESSVFIFKRLLLLFIILDEVIDTIIMEFFISKIDWRRKCGLFVSILSNFLIAFII